MTAPRLVLDTNILLSGLLFGGPPGEILRLGLKRSVDLFISIPLQQEFERVLLYKFPHAYLGVKDSWEILQYMMHLVTPSETIHAVAEDPDDNRVLECAVCAHAHAIISGDRHLLTLKNFRDIPILRAAEFLEHFHKHRS